MPYKSKRKQKAYDKAYREKNRERRRAYDRAYKRAQRSGALTCGVCNTRRESVRVRVCDCNRHLLKRFERRTR